MKKGNRTNHIHYCNKCGREINGINDEYYVDKKESDTMTVTRFYCIKCTPFVFEEKYDKLKKKNEGQAQQIRDLEKLRQEYLSRPVLQPKSETAAICPSCEEATQQLIELLSETSDLLKDTTKVCVECYVNHTKRAFELREAEYQSLSKSYHHVCHKAEQSFEAASIASKEAEKYKMSFEILVHELKKG